MAMFPRCCCYFLAAALIAASSSAGPALFFAEGDLPDLRRRAEAGEHALVWKSIRDRAERMITPGSNGYADPAKIDSGGPERITVRAHTYGRRLTDWAETLGFAYQITGDERFAQHGARVLCMAAERLPISDDRVAKSFAGARGDLMRGFAVGLDWLGKGLTDEERKDVESVAAGYVRNILADVGQERMWWVPHHNFMGVALGGAGLLSLKLTDAYPHDSPKWTDECVRQVSRWFTEGFDEQGAYCEGTSYAHYGLTNAIRFADALLRHDGRDLFDHPRLRRVPHFYAMSLLPGDRVFDARNDATYAGLGDPFILRMAGAWGDGLARWLWERCGSGSSPLRVVWANEVKAATPTAPLAEHFVGRGLCVFRTGWQAKDVMFAIEAGPFYPIPHDQADKGHFTLYGLGRRWAIDSGYGNNRDPKGAAQTVAHNCLLIDGRGQALTGAGTGTNGKIVAYEDRPEYGYALADCTEAYNRDTRGRPGIGVRHALRHALFVRPSTDTPAYAVILDDIQRDNAPHDYEWLLHTHSATRVVIDEHGAQLQPEATPGGEYVETPAESKIRGTCTWTFSTTESGRYVVWARVRATGEIVSKSDSFFVSVDGGKPVPWHMRGSRDWVWDKAHSGILPRKPVHFDLQPGTHRLQFATREPGAQVDRVVVTSDLEHGAPVWDEDSTIVLKPAAGRIAGGMRRVRESRETAPPRMKVVLSAVAPVSLRLDSYRSHPRLNATARAVRPEFVGVLLPLPATVADPPVTIERGDDVRVTVEWPRRKDIIIWPAAGQRKPTVDLRR